MEGGWVGRLDLGYPSMEWADNLISTAIIMFHTLQKARSKVDTLLCRSRSFPFALIAKHQGDSMPNNFA
jgi:hypothetical protein